MTKVRMKTFMRFLFPIAVAALSVAVPTADIRAQELDADLSAEADASFDEPEPAEPSPAPEPKPAPPPAAEEEGEEPQRELSRVQNTLYGTTGLLRVVAADSDDAGTFRVGLIANYYTGSEFLCPRCALPDGTETTLPDDATQVGTRLGLSFTPAAFLEGYGGLRFQTTENSQGDPAVVNIVGDAHLGLKGFMPVDPHRLYGFGGAAEMLLTNTPGGVGIDAVSVRLRALATLDLNRSLHEEDSLPLRAHLNLGYLFNNSGVLADDTEGARRAILDDDTRITRIERFGHDIDRVDSFELGLGVEGTFELIRPFLEWTVDVPVNRQSHVCDTRVRSLGDGCLDGAGFSATPSRISLGARAYPWYENWTRGLSFLVGFDIGTGATSTFIEEVAPETPWTLHIGLAYGVDTEPRIERQIIEKEAPVVVKPERRIMGVVVRVGTDVVIPGAILRYEGIDATGMVANSEGKFESGLLDPGDYSLSVSAEGFETASCVVTVPEENDQGGQDVSAWVECGLKALPDTAILDGVVRDAATTMPIAEASVKIVDPLGRSLTLSTDAQGAFRFENVKSGVSHLTITREGYLPSSSEYNIEARKDQTAQITLNPEPTTPNVVVTADEIKIKQQIQFLHGSAKIGQASDALIQEIAKTLNDHPEIKQVEVQGHTDDTGTPAFNQDLSQRRAEAVRKALVENGVEASRMTAKGYGEKAPLVPNSSDRNRAKNRRVQFVIRGKE